MSSSTPSEMKAWAYRKTGKPASVLQLEQAWPVPTPTAEAPILVKLRAAAFNPVGYKMMSLPPSFMVKTPAIPESDFSGVVAGGNLSGTGFEIGDEVFGIVTAEEVHFKTGNGTLAEYTLAKPACLAKKPKNISFSQAASIPLAGLTAFTTLAKSGNLKSGQRVLINGSTGGVGIWAVQIAKALGCHVVATCSGSSAELVKSLGADEIVDYKKGDLAGQLTEKYGSEGQKFDVVFDTIGLPDLHRKSVPFTKADGIFLAISIPMDSLFSIAKALLHVTSSTMRPTWLGGTPLRFKVVGLKAEQDKDLLEQLRVWMEEGKVKAVIDSEYAFEDAQKAYEKIMSGRSKGKVVLKVTA